MFQSSQVKWIVESAIAFATLSWVHLTELLAVGQNHVHVPIKHQECPLGPHPGAYIFNQCLMRSHQLNNGVLEETRRVAKRVEKYQHRS